MIRKTALVAALGFALAAVAPAVSPDASAQAAGKPDHAGPKDDRPAVGAGQGRDAGAVLITAAAAALIERYFADDRPGYLRPEPLPPGIARNLARGKPLPPGIAKKQLPQSLLGRLPHYEGHRYYAVGRDVVLVAAATGIIVDVLADAL